METNVKNLIYQFSDLYFNYGSSEWVTEDQEDMVYEAAALVQEALGESAYSSIKDLCDERTAKSYSLCIANLDQK